MFNFLKHKTLTCQITRNDAFTMIRALKKMIKAYDNMRPPQRIVSMRVLDMGRYTVILRMDKKKE